MTPNLRIDDAEDILLKGQNDSDPNVVEGLLTREMLSLSVGDRNDIQEEIHGVKCLAVEETPELIRTSLQELSIELDKNIPDSKKMGYLRSKKSLPEQEITEQEQIIDELHVIEPLHQKRQTKSYIHESDFLLRFLRCACFDVKKAAGRLVKYVDLLVELFGEYALWRPIRLSDFSKEELRHMRKGLVQLLPYRDRSGRRIIVFFPQAEISPFTKAKITMYNSWVAGYNDVVTQRKGLIVVVWYDAAFSKDVTWKIKYKFYDMVSTRLSAIHVCSPDTSYYRFRRSLTTMRVGAEYRPKLIFHLGESVEILYQLQSYGIPTEHVPISWTGKLKVNYLKQWIRTRQAIEHPEDQNRFGNHEGSDTSSGLSSCAIIECPQFYDVIFRQGTSGISHPGNVTFRSLIEFILLKAEDAERLNHEECKEKRSKKAKIKRPKQLALDIFAEQQLRNNGKGQFLIWNNEKGWWNELNDRDQILMKIEYMVREFQKLFSKSAPKQSALSKTTNAIQKRNSQKIQVDLQSDTSLFESDGSAKNAFCTFQTTQANHTKRQKLSGFVSGSSDESGDDFDMKKPISVAECFGMRFVPSIE